MSGEPKTILERVHIAETHEIMRRQQTGFKTVDQWEAEISRLQQELSDCKASLRATEAGLEAEGRAHWIARDKLKAAEARVKQLRAALEEYAKALEAKAFAVEEVERDARTWGGPDPRGRDAETTNLAKARQLRETARSIRALGQTEPGEQA